MAQTIAELAGVDIDAESGLRGESLGPLFGNQQSKIRDHVFFAQQWPWYRGVEQTRYASTGVFDGRHKYCRYYGIGGGNDAGGKPLPGKIRFDRDAHFDDHEHEWYDLHEDPHELVNLAMDRGRRLELRQRFDDLIALEEETYVPLRTA